MGHNIHKPFSPARIQYLLKERGITQKQIAIEENRCEMIVSDVINLKRVSKKIMDAIAYHINVNPQIIFGRRYNRAGIKGRPKNKR